MQIRLSIAFILAPTLLIGLAVAASPGSGEPQVGSAYAARNKLRPYAQFLADLADRPRRVVYTPYPVSAQRGTVRGFVHVTDGTAVLSRTDLVVDAPLPIVIRRAFHSARAATRGSDFGLGGWRLTAQEAIERQPDGGLRYMYGNGAVLQLGADGEIRSPLQAYLTDVVAVSVASPGAVQVRTRAGLLKRFRGAGEVLQLADVSDGYGNRLDLHYSPAGRLTGITSSSGARVEVRRNAAGAIDRVVDSRGRAVSYAYDAAGRLLSVTDLGGHPWSYEYDPAGRLISTTTPNGIEDTSFTYDGAGRVTSSRANGWRHRFEYEGSQTRVTDGHGSVTTFTAASTGITVGIANPLGTSTVLALNEDGVPVKLLRNGTAVAEFLQLRAAAGTGFRAHVVDPASGQSYWLRYDGLGRVVTVSSEQGGPLYQVHGYGPGLVPQRIVHADRTEVRAQFDARGELELLRRRDGTSLRFHREGLFWNIEGADGRRAQLRFDVHGRLGRAETPDGHVLSFAYNELGLREEMQTSYGARVRYHYDTSGSLFHSQVSAGAHYAPAYTYVLGPEQRIDAVAGSDGAATRFLYDAHEQVTGVRPAAGEPLDFRYDGQHRLTGVEHGGRAPIEYRYAEGEPDIVGQLTVRTLPVFSQRREISDVASRFEVELTRVRAAGLGLFTDDEVSNELTVAAHPSLWDPAAPLTRSIAALKIDALLGPDPRGIASFATPSNRLFVPAEYWSVNCCVCLCGPEHSGCYEP